jgi:hypothetical protein
VAFFVYRFGRLGLLAAMAADPDFVTRSIFAEPEFPGVNHGRTFCRPGLYQLI